MDLGQVQSSRCSSHDGGGGGNNEGGQNECLVDGLGW